MKTYPIFERDRGGGRVAEMSRGKICRRRRPQMPDRGGPQAPTGRARRGLLESRDGPNGCARAEPGRRQVVWGTANLRCPNGGNALNDPSASQVGGRSWAGRQPARLRPDRVGAPVMKGPRRGRAWRAGGPLTGADSLFGWPSSAMCSSAVSDWLGLVVKFPVTMPADQPAPHIERTRRPSGAAPNEQPATLLRRDLLVIGASGREPMRNSAECLAKAVELSLQAELTGSPVAAELREMADSWRSLARLATLQDALSLQLLESHPIQ